MGPPPRICILTETYYPVVGGGETQARALARGLVDNGLAVMVITRRSDAGFKKIEEVDGITVYRLPPSGRQHLKKWGLLLTAFPMLLRLRRKYDVIFVSGFRVIGVTAVFVSKLFDKVSILKADSLGEMSGAFFAGGMARVGLRANSGLFELFIRIRNRLLRGAYGFVAISCKVSDELTSHGVPPSRVYSIPNSVNTRIYHPVSAAKKRELRRKLGLPQERLIVIFTGRLVSYKGLPLLLDVWRKLEDNYQQVCLVLVGSGSLDIDNCEEQLKESVHTHRLQGSVLFAGEVQNVHEYLQASDIFVFPSENEAFGISVIEAMACRLPIVATDIGGLKDIVKNEDNALVVRVGSFNELYNALVKLIVDRTLASKIAFGAWQTAQEKYAAEIVNRRYFELFTRAGEIRPDHSRLL